MKLYVETNFLLEIAYLQPQHAACDRLLASAQRGEIELALPALCLIEARASLDKQGNQRQRFYEELRGQIHELARREPYREIESASLPLAQALLSCSAQDVDRLAEVLYRLQTACDCLPLTMDVAAHARTLEQAHDLAPYDAAVLAGVRQDLFQAGPGPHCFVTRNSNDFNRPLLHSELSALDCKLLFNFEDAEGWSRHQLASRPAR